MVKSSACGDEERPFHCVIIRYYNGYANINYIIFMVNLIIKSIYWIIFICKGAYSTS